MKFKLLLIYVLSLNSYFFSQISDISFGLGVDGVTNNHLSFNDFLTISEFNKKYFEYEPVYESNGYNVGFKLEFGFDLLKKKTKDFRLIYRIGTNNFHGVQRREYTTDIIQSIDSVYVPANNSYLYNGIVINELAKMSLFYKNNFVENSISVNLFPNRRTSFEFGFTLQTGRTYLRHNYNFIHIDSSSFEGVKTASGLEYVKTSLSKRIKPFETAIIDQSNFLMGFAFPMNLDIRLGKIVENKGHTHLLFTLKPTVQFTYFKSLEKFNRTSLFNFGFLTFRYFFKTKEG
jgi:hypothetical protein